MEGHDATFTLVSPDEDWYFNDAIVSGPATPAYKEILNQKATILTGVLWSQGDKRNTQDGKWKPLTLSWDDWIKGQPGSANAPAWGFSRHPEGKHKAGPGVVFGASIGGVRKTKGMETMYAMALDIDSGAHLDDVLDRIEELGLFCLVYTSYNHGKRGLELKRDDVLRKLKIKTDPTLDAVKEYLRDHSKDHFEEDFLAEIEIAEQKKQRSDGVKIVLDTPPLDKFRLILPLAAPVKLIDLASTQDEALKIWEDKICGLAVNMLGVHFDTSCTDVSRLFYTARHPKGNSEWGAYVVRGDPLRFGDVPSYPKASYTKNRDANPFLAAGGASDKEEVPQCYTPSGRSLNDWHRIYKDKFLLADLLETYCSDRIRVAGSEAHGHVHIECPFEHEHSSEGGFACMAVNSIDAQSEYWTWFCHHDSCQGRHKLQFLEEALRQGWFDENLLFDADEGYILSADDEEEAEELQAKVEAVKAGPLKLKKRQDVEDAVAKLGDKPEDADIDAFIERIKGPLKDAVYGDLVKALKKPLNVPIAVVRKRLSHLRQKAADEGAIDLENRYNANCDEVHKRMTDQGDDPRLFHSTERLTTLEWNERGNLRIVPLDKDGFRSRIEQKIEFIRGESYVGCPHDVVNNVFHRPKSDYPPLHRVIMSPVYDADMNLITDPGYHPESGLFYQPKDGFDMARVSEDPTEEEVERAVEDLIDLFADFPLEGLTRAELEEIAEGREVPSFCHVLSACLTPICREFIEGPTPGHLARKDKPRTGASLIMDTSSWISMLEAPKPQSLPSRKEEVQKTIVSTLDSGIGEAYWDNLPDDGKVDFGELAAAITAWPTYSARRLGVSEMIECVVKVVWKLTGNRTALSEELAGRVLLIDLDPKLENPGTRPKSQFKYDLKTYAPANAGRYLHALLTLVQYCKACGCPMWEGTPMGGFEAHNKIIGGVLDNAGIFGFLDNREKLKATVMSDNPEHALLDALIEEHHKRLTVFRVGSTTKVPKELGKGEDAQPFPYADARVVDVCDVLNEVGVAIPHWGYALDRETGSVIYPHSSIATIRQRLRAMQTTREWTEDREDVVKRQGRYTLRLVHRDKHGNIYAFERLPLIPMEEAA
ncbi:MAG: hypothetical protein AAFU80_06810 [Pseudomonadota bacterium]